LVVVCINILSSIPIKFLKKYQRLARGQAFFGLKILEYGKNHEENCHRQRDLSPWRFYFQVFIVKTPSDLTADHLRPSDFQENSSGDEAN